MGHSLGANNAIYLANRMPDYFSKAVICSGGLAEYPTIPIRWYVGSYEVDYYKNAAYKYENHYGKIVVCWLPGVQHQTPIPAYMKDDGEFFALSEMEFIDVELENTSQKYNAIDDMIFNWEISPIVEIQPYEEQRNE